MLENSSTGMARIEGFGVSDSGLKAYTGFRV